MSALKRIYCASCLVLWSCLLLLPLPGALASAGPIASCVIQHSLDGRGIWVRLVHQLASATTVHPGTCGVCHGERQFRLQTGSEHHQNRFKQSITLLQSLLSNHVRPTPPCSENVAGGRWPGGGPSTAAHSPSSSQHHPLPCLWDSCLCSGDMTAHALIHAELPA
jgi:hypothetical protein